LPAVGNADAAKVAPYDRMMWDLGTSNSGDRFGRKQGRTVRSSSSARACWFACLGVGGVIPSAGTINYGIHVNS